MGDGCSCACLRCVASLEKQTCPGQPTCGIYLYRRASLVGGYRWENHQGGLVLIKAIRKTLVAPKDDQKLLSIGVYRPAHLGLYIPAVLLRMSAA
jgi:hypothetical protein